MAYEDNNVKHLEIIQGVINRLAANSFQLKSWSVAVITALFALAASNSRTTFIFLAYLPALTFWGLDAFYLREERLYRRLYDKVRLRGATTPTDFSMDTSEFRNAWTWPCALFSRTMLAFHLVLIASMLTIMVLGFPESN